MTAIVRSTSGKKLSLVDVKEFCKGQLAGFKVPKKVLNFKEPGWPVTRIGKIDKIKLRQWAIKQVGIEG